MWKIFYTIDKRYRDKDNYSTSISGDLEEVTGDTYEDAVETLITDLKKTPVLKHIIDTYALNLNSYDECYDITIESVIEITDSKHLNFKDIPIVKTLIKERKELEAKTKAKVDSIDKPCLWSNLHKHYLAMGYIFCPGCGKALHD